MSGEELSEAGEEDLEPGASMPHLSPGGVSVLAQSMHVASHPPFKTPVSAFHTHPGLLMVPSMTSTPQGQCSTSLPTHTVSYACHFTTSLSILNFINNKLNIIYT